ncbi:MAG: hypothetical protein M1834_003835 [Cirrosporium novae-zelandiae]|nr:MAG: hypothetical protein M1834_003835 [Cirrosporium novae-zelandiae]
MDSTSQQQQSPKSATSLRQSDIDKISPNGNWSGNDSGDDPQTPQDADRKRKRPMSVSCELCKQRKVKCDRGQPSCGWCSRNGQLCEYKERKKPGLRAGYGRELEQRLDRLESLIHSQGRLIQEHIATANGGSQQQSSPNHQEVFTSPSLVQAPHIPRPETALFLQKPSLFQDRNQSPSTLSGALNTSFVPAEASPTDSYQQHNPPQPQQAQHRTNLDGLMNAPQAFYMNNQPQLESPSLNITNGHTQEISQSDNDFPPYDLLYALADLYFKHINTWCPILHRRTTLDALFGPSTLEEADRILLHAIVATTLRFSIDARLNEENRRRYHNISKQKVLLYGLENSSVKALQALVILALDLVGSANGNGPPAWNVLAIMTRSVVQLGLSVEATSPSIAPNYPSIYTLRAMVLPEPKSWIEDECRRRLFWMVYLLDRYATVATAFDFCLDEKDIDRKLPCRDDLFARNQAVETRWFRPNESDRTEYEHNKPENMGSYSYYIEVVGILSRIHQFLKKPVDISALSDVEQWQSEYRELDTLLSSWKFNLPNEYGNMARLFNSNTSNKIVNCGWVMLHATFQTTVIRLHSSAAYPTTRSPIFTPSLTASKRCLTAVENIQHLTQYVVNNGMLNKLGPPFAFTVWVASRLLLVQGSTIEHKVSPDIVFFVDTLREMGKYWEVAQRYAALLSRVLEEYHESEQTVGADGERHTPSSVRILADMRRCAFDLDFLISRQPRTHSTAVSAPPTRTPAPNELEYLDVFDWFNMPRLTVPVDVHQQQAMNHPNRTSNVTSAPQQPGGAVVENIVPTVPGLAATGSNEFNITNYMVPNPQSDWLGISQE